MQSCRGGESTKKPGQLKYRSKKEEVKSGVGGSAVSE